MYALVSKLSLFRVQTDYDSSILKLRTIFINPQTISLEMGFYRAISFTRGDTDVYP